MIETLSIAKSSPFAVNLKANGADVGNPVAGILIVNDVNVPDVNVIGNDVAEIVAPLLAAAVAVVPPLGLLKVAYTTPLSKTSNFAVLV